MCILVASNRLSDVIDNDRPLFSYSRSLTNQTEECVPVYDVETINLPKTSTCTDTFKKTRRITSLSAKDKLNGETSEDSIQV